MVTLVVERFRPRWDGGYLIRYAGYMSGIVAMSAVLISVVLLAGETNFPAKAYEWVAQPVWGVVFLLIGLFHSWRLIRWWAGYAEPYLVPAHLAQVFISSAFLAFSVWSTFTMDSGFLVSVFILGGAVMALLTSQLPLWDDPATAAKGPSVRV